MTVTCAWTRTLSSAAWTGTRRSCLTQRLFSSSSSTNIPTRDLDLERIAIVGGGLAGLSTAFHLLEKTQGKLEVTIFDTAPVGTKGASSVAGGYVLYLLRVALRLSLVFIFYSSGIINIFATLY
jgi:hypothetical protein